MVSAALWVAAGLALGPVVNLVLDSPGSLELVRVGVGCPARPMRVLRLRPHRPRPGHWQAIAVAVALSVSTLVKARWSRTTEVPLTEFLEYHLDNWSGRRVGPGAVPTRRAHAPSLLLGSRRPGRPSRWRWPG